MNKLPAEITTIKKSGDISLITLVCEGESFSAIIINNQEEYIQEGNLVYMVFKETEVSIGKNLIGGLSIRNRFSSVIESIEKGALLSEIRLSYKSHRITSIITTQSCEMLNLRISDNVEGLLKTTELFIMKYD